MLLALFNPLAVIRYVGPLLTFAGIVACLFFLVTGRIDLERLAANLARYAGRTPGASTFDASLSELQIDKPLETVWIATFNAEKLSSIREGAPPELPLEIARLFSHFDVIAIQSLRPGNGDPFGEVLRLLDADSNRYQMITSRLVGPLDRREQFAFVFDTKRVRIDRRRVYTVDDPEDRLRYEPFVAHFAAIGDTNPSRPPFTFSLINGHLDGQGGASRFLQEQRAMRDAIANIAQWEASRFDEDDFIITGNLDGARNELTEFAVFPGLIPLPPSTPTRIDNSREVDHILIDRFATSEWTHQAGVIDFERDFGMSQAMIRGLSDHRMLWAQFSAYEVPRIQSLPTTPAPQVQALQKSSHPY